MKLLCCSEEEEKKQLLNDTEIIGEQSCVDSYEYLKSVL